MLQIDRILLIGAVVLTCAVCSRPRDAGRSVCLDLPTAADNAEAWRGISWWGEPVRQDCGLDSILVHQGEAPPDHPWACGWNDGKSEITWTCGPVFVVVRHEYGHLLGFGDSEFGVMASGGVW